jgi:hypothetical protein
MTTQTRFASIGASLALLLLSACSTTEPGKTAAADDGLVCQREVPTGTLRSVSRCRLATDVDKDRADAERTLGTVRGASPGDQTLSGR